MKKKIRFILCLLAILCCVTTPVLAATNTEGIAVPKSPAYYPVEVNANEQDGCYRLEKVYHLTKADNPAEIPTDPVSWEGRNYVFLELLKEDQSITDREVHCETITVNSNTNNLEKILKTLEPTMEISTEDGYTGMLTLDPGSIQVNTAGYKNYSRTVSASRTYPNLSDADTALIPKTITENGCSLTLTDVQWQNAATDYQDGYDLAMRYTAVATYSGTATGKTATGYTVTANYIGEVEKASSDTIVYTAVFAAASAPVFLEKMGDASYFWLLLVVIIITAILAYYGPKQYQHYVNKKRGYEE